MRGGACLAAKVIGRRVDDRTGVADERDRLGRTRSSSETAGGVLPRSRRKKRSEPTHKSSGAAPLARMFSLLG